MENPAMAVKKITISPAFGAPRGFLDLICAVRVYILAGRDDRPGIRAYRYVTATAGVLAGFAFIDHAAYLVGLK